MRSSCFRLVTAGVACVMLSVALCGAADEAPLVVTGEDRTAILTWVCETLTARYVEPDVARAMAAAIRERATAGAYDALDTADGFLNAVEVDLQAVSHDKHVGVWAERLEDVKDDDADYTPADAEYVERLRRTNYGIKKVEILPGNIGYLRIDEFAHPALGGPTAVAAMNTVGSVDALIIDLRWNGGGAGLVDLVSSYFFAEPAHLNDTWERASGETRQSWTTEWVPGPSLANAPLFILTSAQTFSAAESFAYGLQQLGRATVVGELTKGGGHPVEFVRLLREGMAVAMMVPNAKSINHVSGSSWEGVGVEPNLAVPASDSLAAAYDAAADALAERSANPNGRARVEWGRETFRSVLHPVELTRAQLEEYAGTFESRSFWVGEDDVLHYQREVGSTYPMIPMGDDRFRFEQFDEVRLRFERDPQGQVDRVVSEYLDGSRTVRHKTAGAAAG